VPRPLRVVAAVDKFRGTATAAEVADAVARAVKGLGGTCIRIPLADGGEGLLDVLGGPNRTTVVTGPLGDDVSAAWRLSRGLAVIEMARASGLALVGGAEGNDPIAASTEGTGELITAAIDAGATRVVVGAGGSATTDGGLGAVRAIVAPRLKRVQLQVACDVRTRFVDAATVFAPQKGATPAQVELLRRRLERLVQVYRETYGVDVSDLEHAGAAGGLGGGLAALGADLVSGFDLVAEEVRLAEAIAEADLVVTGEGYLDAQSFDGKVVGGVLALARAEGVPVLAVTGDADEGVADGRDGFTAVSLVARVGEERAHTHTCDAVAEVVAAVVVAAEAAGLSRRRPS
jgi:glycerate kinase